MATSSMNTAKSMVRISHIFLFMLFFFGFIILTPTIWQRLLKNQNLKNISQTQIYLFHPQIAVLWLSSFITNYPTFDALLLIYIRSISNNEFIFTTIICFSSKLSSCINWFCTIIPNFLALLIFLCF